MLNGMLIYKSHRTVAVCVCVCVNMCANVVNYFCIFVICSQWIKTFSKILIGFFLNISMRYSIRWLSFFLGQKRIKS